MTQKTAEEFQAAAKELMAEAKKCGYPAVVIVDTDKATIIAATGTCGPIAYLLDQTKLLLAHNEQNSLTPPTKEYMFYPTTTRRPPC